MLELDHFEYGFDPLQHGRRRKKLDVQGAEFAAAAAAEKAGGG
jgi:hypothetical protein